MTASITDILVALASGQDAPPQDHQDVFQLSLLDWLACGIAGANEPVADILRDAHSPGASSPQGACHIFAGAPLGAPEAALINGAISHALDYDDTHFAHIGHPSVAVLPAALALAEQEGLDGKTFQKAGLLGVEASVRMGLWLGRAHYQVGYHQTATAGAIGATVAACHLLNLTDDQTRHALGLAATQAAGLKAQFGTMGKPYNAGLAARTGVEVARLARAGFSSNPEALEAFGATHHGAGGTASQDWHFADVSHKLHACCHGLHAALEALSELGPFNGVQAISIETHPRWMSVCNQTTPETGLAAKFSYRAVAAMAVCGIDTAHPESYSDALMQQGQLEPVMAAVQVFENAALAETEALVQVTDENGRRAARHDLLAKRPFGTRRDKVLAKAEALVGTQRAQGLWHMIQENAAPTDIGAAL